MSPSPASQPGFLRFMASRFAANLSRQTVLLVAMWQIYALTSQPLMLGIIGLVQGVPYVLGSLYAGHLVDRHEKRRLILLSLIGLTATVAGLALLSRSASPSLIGLFFMVGLSAVFNSLEMPAASAYLQILIPAQDFSKAAAWNLANYVGATVLGPIIGGFLLEHISPMSVYAICCGGFVLSVVLALPLRRMHPAPVTRDEPVMESVKAGLRFVVSRRIIFAAMVLDSFAVLFGEIVFILPVFADRLEVGPLGLGFLRAAPALGSCLVSVLQATRPVIRISWAWLQGAVAIFGLCIISFGFSTLFPLSLLLLAMGGAADGVSVIIRQSLYQKFTPDEYRGRVASVSGIFISISNEFGGFESGLAAQLLGPVPAVIVGGLITLATVGFIHFRYPGIGKEPERAA